MATSTEGKNFGLELPGLQSVFTHAELNFETRKVSAPAQRSPKTPMILHDLLSLNGGQFVDAAYLRLLKRMPDPDGYKYRLGQLFAGIAKIKILGEISTSSEAAAVGMNIQGLSVAFVHYKLGCIPIIGTALRLFFDIEGNSSGECHQRRVAQRLYKLEAEVYRIQS